MIYDRSSEIKDMKKIVSPEEQGSSKDARMIFEKALKRLEDHVTAEWDEGGDVAYVLQPDGEAPKFSLPPPLTEEQKKDEWLELERKGKAQETLARKLLIEKNKRSLYGTITKYLSEVLKTKLATMHGYKEKHQDKDVEWLVQTLRNIMAGFDGLAHPLIEQDEQLQELLLMRQGPDEGNKDYVNRMTRDIKTYMAYGGSNFLWGPKQLAEADEKLKKALEDDPHLDKLTKKDEIRKELDTKMMAMVIFRRADPKRFSGLINSYHNGWVQRQQEYPKTTVEVLSVLESYRAETPTQSTIPTSTGGTGSSISFLQSNGNTEQGVDIPFLKGTDGNLIPTMTCHLCKFKGHKMECCPVSVDTQGTKLPNPRNRSQATVRIQEVSRRVTGYAMNQTGGPNLNPNWVLLDSESSNHTFKNPNLVTNIRNAANGEVLRMYGSSGGHLDNTQEADFGSIRVWLNENGIANILSLGLVTDDYRVTMDSDVDNALILHLSDQHWIRFERVDEGLYVFDATDVDVSKLRSAFSFLSTVEANKGMFQAREVRKADEALQLNRRTNHMAAEKFQRVIQNGLIRNSPVTVGDVRRSNVIYGPPIPPIKGRTRYQNAPRTTEKDIMQLPAALYEELKNVTLCIDYHFVNGIPVFHSISRRLDYRTVAFPRSRSKKLMIQEFRSVQRKYHSRGFRITDVHADKEFEKIETEILPARLVCCGVDEHVPEIERSVQTQKNENRSVCQSLPYKCLPKVMVRAIIKQGNAFLNAFGNGKILGHGLTPRNIIDNLPHVDYNDLKYELGEYVQLHVTELRTNTMATRTIGAVVLDPRNITGRYNFMSLETGCQIDGRVVARLPITPEVIRRVEEIGRQQRQPVDASRMLQYEWRPNRPVITLGQGFLRSVEPEMVLPVPIAMPGHADNDLPANPHHLPVETGADIEEFPHQDDEDQGAQDDTMIEDQGAHTDENRGEQFQEPDELNGTPEFQVDETQGVNIDGQQEKDRTAETVTEPEDLEELEDDIGAKREEEKARRSEHLEVHVGDNYGRGKRTKKERSFSLVQARKCGGRRYKNLTKRKNKVNKRTKEAYSFLQKEYKDLSKDENLEYFKLAWRQANDLGDTHLLERYTAAYVFASMSAKKGIKKYGEAAEKKLIEELAQLLDYKVFHGIDALTLTAEQKTKAANMINLVEEKLNRGHTDDNPVLRARSVFNGKVQRGLYTKEQTASPTATLDGFLLTCITDAIEGRDVAITDIKAAYLNAVMKDIVHMKISGPEVRILCELDPKLKQFVTTEQEKEVLYVQLDKALYGCVKSALLWYETYVDTLKDIGFELNPYDPCVANANIDGKQCTIVFYVDDNKISHVDPKVVDSVIEKLEAKYGKMSTTRGTDLQFLGMDIKYKDGMVTIGMQKHIQKAIDEFAEEIARSAATPAKPYLFNVRKGSKALDDKKSDNFHSVVAALLYVSRRCRLDIQTAIGFLTTRVSTPTEDDWDKLRRVLQYLYGTIDLELTVGGKSLTDMEAWVDVAYGVHDDCRSHTGGCISFGWGVISTMCKKQKLNVKSSTEGEIVGVSDYLPNMIWVRMFLQEQGYQIKENILHQDNQSAMKIELNGKQSSGKKTKHMDNRFFWIKDRLKSEGIEVKYCQTAKMIGDFFTKPLSGSQFKLLRDVVMGKLPTSYLENMGSDETSTNTEWTPDQERVRQKDSVGESGDVTYGIGDDIGKDAVRGKSTTEKE